MTSDAAGNLTRDRADRELVYDAQNRLTSVKLSGNTIAEFRYNALGQRTHKIGAQGTSVFLYGPDGQLLGESQYGSTGQKLGSQFYIWLDSLPLGGISVTYDGQGAIASSTPFYLHNDHLNTPRLATNQSQQNVWQWQSDAFGVGQASGSLSMNLRFPGQYFDQETGLHYNYFRDYDPETGRYVESDPIGLAGGLNTFGYVEGNPISKIDFYGLSSTAVTPLFCRGWSCAVAAAAQACASLNPSDIANSWASLQLQQTQLIISTVAAINSADSGAVPDPSSGNDPDRGDLTKAGRAGQKHGDRAGSAFPPATGSAADKNRQGQDILDGIVNSPDRTDRPNRHGGTDVHESPDGRGARFDQNGKFTGFLEPR